MRVGGSMMNSPGVALFLSTVHAADRPKRIRGTSDIIINKFLLVFMPDLLNPDLGAAFSERQLDCLYTTYTRTVLGG